MRLLFLGCLLKPHQNCFPVWSNLAGQPCNFEISLFLLLIGRPSERSVQAWLGASLAREGRGLNAEPESVGRRQLSVTTREHYFGSFEQACAEALCQHDVIKPFTSPGGGGTHL